MYILFPMADYLFYPTKSQTQDRARPDISQRGNQAGEARKTEAEKDVVP
jgi:hypothetical protein